MALDSCGQLTFTENNNPPFLLTVFQWKLTLH